MSKKTIKPKKFLFFATFFYGLLFWALLLFTIVMGIILFTAKQKMDGSDYVLMAILAIATIGMCVIRNVRRKSLCLRLPIVPNNLPYTPDEVKHYVGLQEKDTVSDDFFDMCNAYQAMRKSKNL